MKILLDNGHGQNTAGKRSPDGRLREYEYAREIAKEIERKLKTKGYEAECIVRESIDVPLAERCRRVNEQCRKYGAGNVLLVSVHCDAAGGDGKWHNAGGWSAYTTKGKTKSDALATELYKSAAAHLKGYEGIMEAGKKTGAYSVKQRAYRTDYTDGDPDMEENYYILFNTKCAAVLTENLFQDNKQDVDFLLSAEGRNAIVDLHVDGIINFITK